MSVFRFVVPFLAVLALHAQAPKETEPGIPVTDATTKAKCGTCHRPDAQGNLTRISWIRTTPEGWQEAIKRMVRLNGLTLTPTEARQIVQYLSASHGIAPQEAAPVAWHTEMRQIVKEELPNDDVRDGCAACHALARPQSWYRSKNEWRELVNMHLGYFPTVEFTSFRRRGPAVTRPDGTKAPDPVDAGVEHFSKTNLLHSPAWAQWQSAMREPKLAGRWLLSATKPGEGRFFGEMQIQAGATPTDVTMTAKLTSVATGKTYSLNGRAVIYTGYAWRGRANSTDDPKEVRQVMMVARDQGTMEGRWFWGAYQEFGWNVKAQRESADPSVLGTDLLSLAAGRTGAKLRIFGDRLPVDLKPADLDLGAGVTVKRVLSQSASTVEVEADVDAKAVPGARDIAIKRSTLTNGFIVYDKIDYLKIGSDASVARLGGARFPKGYAQFEAIGYHRGIDGKVNTPDDVALGPVPVTWSLEEFYARYEDDDKEYVGSLSAAGLFTPALEGPNPQRKFLANNFGDVWVVATYQGLTAKGYLVVTVPQYVRWDQPEVAE